MSLRVAELQTPLYVGGDFEVTSAIRKGAVVTCEAHDDAFPTERFVVEFESEELASNFCRNLANGGASIEIEEDRSIDAAPDELKRAYTKAKSAGDTTLLPKILEQLWEDYGIDPEDQAPRKTSGVKRIAIMHDDGVAAWGFKGMHKALREWMNAHGFPKTRGTIEVE